MTPPPAKKLYLTIFRPNHRRHPPETGHLAMALEPLTKRPQFTMSVIDIIESGECNGEDKPKPFCFEGVEKKGW